MMILIGSRALKLRGQNLIRRDPVDFDWVCTQEDYEAWVGANLHKVGSTKEPYEVRSTGGTLKRIIEGRTNCEFEIVQPGTSSELLAQLVAADPTSTVTPMGTVPSLDLLFTIKSSHKHLKNSPHFWKTLEDYHRMKRAGAATQDIHKAFLKLRERETYTYKHPNLGVSKAKFFADDMVTYTYDHDSLHQAVKTLERPAYTYFSKDGQEVSSSRTKFEATTEQVRLLSVVEESAVLALERSLVPFPGVKTPAEAWHFAFSKVLTSITSGWWRAWAYEHAYEVLKLYPADYVSRFEAGLKAGVVKLATVRSGSGIMANEANPELSS